MGDLVADIVVSYKSDERGQAGYIVALLEAAGFSLWWDQKLTAGKSYDRAILEEIDKAKCVIVCWSHQSVHSDWVRSEAKIALDDAKILPVRFDDVRIPPPFSLLHNIDLSAWKGLASDPNWIRVIRHCREVIDPSGKSAVDIATYANSAVSKSGHLVHKIKAKDTTGKFAYYFVLVPPAQEVAFLSAIDGDGMIDLEDFGSVIASCYGESPNTEVKNYLKSRYGFDV